MMTQYRTVVKVGLLSLAMLALGGCSSLGGVSTRHQDEQIQTLLGQLNLCQYDKAERKRMYDAAKMGNKTPYPLLYCEGERSAKLEARFMESRKTTQFEILGSHFEADGHGAALVKIRTPAWRGYCEALDMWDRELCEPIVMGINAPQLKKVDNRQRESLLALQDVLSLMGPPPMMVDYYLMPLKRQSGGELIPNWVENGGAARANLGLAEKLGEEVGPTPVHAYDLQYDLLKQDDLAPQYLGVFYYATPQLLDFAPRPEAQYSVPLRRGVPGRGYRTSVYRAVIGKREFE
ncbi:hypothetical protein [Ferrimonas aestuarii]|uniref:Uncharacterized protein n=1 Tax=Ferrimonas aestuarii TaxID=2569539 RepID=A0A4U1BSU1_9GAMM|nr:hypothetical protein [Ferrimonas aestuarii]TKB56610.1 hypothetical protein FCL42_05605 [Ferrimonas aestuarii]